jgi:hypothetical protein
MTDHPAGIPDALNASQEGETSALPEGRFISANRQGGANGKLCCLLQKTFFAADNACPPSAGGRGREAASEVGRF